MLRASWIGVLSLFLSITAGTAAASIVGTYSFVRITSNSSSNVANQLFVDVVDTGQNNEVLFTFRNAGPIASSIADIYFDDGTLLGIASIINGTGVSFDDPASPSDLPGRNNVSPPFVTTQDFSADSDPPVEANGVNPGESVGILFSLINGKTVNDVVDAIGLGGADGGLRFGLHVQGLPDGESDGFVNISRKFGNEGVPEPAAFVVWSLLSAGALGGVYVRRLRQKAA